MNYKELTAYCLTPQADYYEQLIIHREIILKAYRKLTQAQLGADIGMNQAQVSLLIKLLIVLDEQEDV